VIIHSINPLNFRNLAHKRLEFSPGCNFITGFNGQGKTNLLEALFFILSLKTKRGSVSDNIRKGADSFEIDSSVTFGQLKHRVNFSAEGRKRKLLIDDSPIKRRREYLEQVLAVDFFPEDLLILIMEPSLRRDFIDYACVQYFLPHEDTLKRFKRTIEQRNGLLRFPDRLDQNLLDNFDSPLSEYSALIAIARLQLLSELSEKTDEIFREGIGEKYKAELNYVSSVDGIPQSIRPGESIDHTDFAGIYLSEFRKRRKQDIESGRTSAGPHRDDWSMTLNGKPVRSYASRGEVRSAMFALHLARFHVLSEKRGIKPVVLIDDVMSELDSQRRSRILELLPEGQIFLSSCDPLPETGKIADENSAHFLMEKGLARGID